MTYTAMVSQVQSKVEEKPNIASLPKLRCGGGQQGLVEIKDVIEGAYSDNLLKVERLHLATVQVGAGPFWVEHCEGCELSQQKSGMEERRGNGAKGGVYKSRSTSLYVDDISEGEKGASAAAALCTACTVAWKHGPELGYKGNQPTGQLVGVVGILLRTCWPARSLGLDHAGTAERGSKEPTIFDILDILLFPIYYLSSRIYLFRYI
jgi:hypothetical protein